MAKNDGGPASKVTTPKEEGLRPFFLKVLVNRSLILGPIDVKTVFEDKEEADEICEALNKAWNHRPATDDTGLREFLEEMEHADFNCDCRSEDEEFPGQKESVCSWHTRIKSALFHAPAPEETKVDSCRRCGIKFKKYLGPEKSLCTNGDFHDWPH